MTITSADGTVGRPLHRPRIAACARPRRQRRPRHAPSSKECSPNTTAVWVYSRRGRGSSGRWTRLRPRAREEFEDLLALRAVAGYCAHLVGHSGGAIYSLLAAIEAPLLRSLVLYEPPLRFERFDPSVIDRVQAALDASDEDRALEIIFAAIGVVEPEVDVLRIGRSGVETAPSRRDASSPASSRPGSRRSTG